MSSAADKVSCTALGLISGGLDSTLAAALLKSLGVRVVGVNFHTGFCLTDHRRLLKRGQEDAAGAGKLRNQALRAGADLDMPVEIVDISEEYMEVLTRPRYGYGSAVNPCVDCRIMMLRKAREMMETQGASFIFTGEVMGQRPMTQMRNTMRLIEKQSGLDGLLLRPLTAHNLPETVPERQGLVPRERLYGFRGRGRKNQERLACELGITGYPQPAGGCCFLTDRNYARRLKDLFRTKPQITREDVFLLKLGRHFRVDEMRVIVGRDEPENALLRTYAAGRYCLEILECPAPLVLAEGKPGEETLCRAAAIAARYCDGKNRAGITVHYTAPDGSSGAVTVAPARPEDVESLRV